VRKGLLTASARYLGVDLAWRENRADLPANETGVAAIDSAGHVLDTGWAYKHREDLIDALLCAWTAALCARHGPARCQVLGLPAGDAAAGPASWPAATIIVPARPEQRRLSGSGRGRGGQDPANEVHHSQGADALIVE
jgi:predicted RNase H-like nuclease